MGAIPFPHPPLCDGVVLLRPWREQDAEVKAGWGGDADIVRWTAVPRGYTERAARAQAARNEAERLEGRSIGLKIADAVSGGLLGACELRRPDPVDLQVMSVGYVLDPRARNRGVATRALALVAEWCVRVLSVQRLQALVHPGNVPSIRVLERAGFQREGLLRRYQPGKRGREDRLMYALLAGEIRRIPVGPPALAVRSGVV